MPRGQIGQGFGNWTYNTTAEAIAAFPDNFELSGGASLRGESTILSILRSGSQFVLPPDISTSPAAITQPSWMVVRFVADVPGPINLHCHLSSHFWGGMRVVLAQGYPVVWEYIPKYL